VELPPPGIARKPFLPSLSNPSGQADEPCVATREGFVFAHLTDLHLTRLDEIEPRELANKRILGYLSWRRRRHAVHRTEILEAMVADLRRQTPDHIAISGDLTQLGLPAECREARAWLEQLGPADRVTLVPGNHDQYVKAPWNQTLGLWFDYMASDPGQPTLGNASQLFPSVRVRAPVAFIGVSSVYPCPPFLATGRVGADQRQALERALRRTGDQGLCRVVLIHHPPLPGSYKWRKRLEDAAETTQILRDAGAELVLHGHTHRLMLNDLPTRTGRLPVLGIPSGSASDREPVRRARYFLYRVHRKEEGLVMDWSSRLYDPDSNCFRSECKWGGISTIFDSLPAPRS